MKLSKGWFIVCTPQLLISVGHRQASLKICRQIIIYSIHSQYGGCSRPTLDTDSRRLKNHYGSG